MTNANTTNQTNPIEQTNPAPVTVPTETVPEPPKQNTMNILQHRDIDGKLLFTISGKFGRYQDIKDYLYEIIGYAIEKL